MSSYDPPRGADFRPPAANPPVLIERSEQHRMERLANLGLLAAGIAHDFSNVLTIISMQTDLLLDDLPRMLRYPVEPAARDVVDGVQAISKAATQGAGLTRQLLRLTRPDAGSAGAEPRADLSTTMRHLEPVLRCLRHDSVTVELQVDDIPRTSVEPGQIEQLVLNLAINARDALAEMGVDGPADPHITVRLRRLASPVPPAARRDGTAPATGTATARGRQYTPDLQAAQEWVVIEVIDNGSGMEPEVLARASEPFFTTKDPDRGTGLGLSVVADIADGLGGWAEIFSAPQMGTTVRVTLPTQADDAG